jgi:hypothetical protein
MSSIKNIYNKILYVYYLSKYIDVINIIEDVKSKKDSYNFMYLKYILLYCLYFSIVYAILIRFCNNNFSYKNNSLILFLLILDVTNLPNFKYFILSLKIELLS